MEQILGGMELSLLGDSYRVFYLKEREVAISALEQLLKKDTLLGLDIETAALKGFENDSKAPLDPLRSSPRLVQICDGKNVVVLDMMYVGQDFPELKRFLESGRFIAHNAMFELQNLVRTYKISHIDLGCTFLATKLLYHALYADDSAYKASLGAVVKSLLKVELNKDIAHTAWKNPELNFEQISYAAFDAIAVLKIAPLLARGLEKNGLFKIYKLYKDSQWPLVQMQLNGIAMNEELHRELISKWKFSAYEAKKELLTLTKLEDITAHTMADYLEANLPADVLRVWPRTEGKKLSTDANTFADFDWVDVVEPFRRFQKATILSSTFGMKLQNKISLVTRRLHATYKLAGARTGRLSSSDPNLQNMPRDKDMRRCFVAAPGHVLVVADFSQIELRVAAELSQDAEMVNAYKKGIDLHRLTAAKTSGKRLEDVTDEDRQRAKALNFGLLFGLGKNKFKHYAKKQYKIELTEEEALQAVTDWHELYSGYTKWQQQQAETCKRELRVRTVSGKLRRLSEENYYGASANTQVQGGASEAMLYALCSLIARLKPNARVINTVHDELIVECPGLLEDISAAKTAVKEAMTEGYLEVFPRGITRDLVSVGHGPNWAEAK